MLQIDYRYTINLIMKSSVGEYYSLFDYSSASIITVLCLQENQQMDQMTTDSDAN